MASPQASDKVATKLNVQMWDHDPDSTAARLVSPDANTTKRVVDMRDYTHFAVGAMATVLGGANMTKLEIVASDDAAGATNLTVIKDSGTLAADAQGDWAWLECTAKEIRQESEEGGYALRYVAARITMADAGDEAAVVYIRAGAKRPADGLTAATTIA